MDFLASISLQGNIDLSSQDRQESRASATNQAHSVCVEVGVDSLWIKWDQEQGPPRDLGYQSDSPSRHFEKCT